MIKEKLLSIHISEVYDSNLSYIFNELMSDEILKKTSINEQKLSYSHNILCDYAVKILVIEDDENGGIPYKEILLMDVSSNPELAIFKELFWKELFISLDELPENQKQVFVLNELEDMTLQEIATQTGENLKTIISRKGYAVKHLRNKLNYLYSELEN